jgi:thiamine kinase-like enzyme
MDRPETGTHVTADYPRTQSSFDGVDRLHEALTAALLTTSGAVEILGRQHNPRTSTFASEIVRCRLAAMEAPAGRSRDFAVFVKRGPRYSDPHSGHNRGVPYEIDAYRRILPLLNVARPELLGTFQEPGPGWVAWLFVEYIQDAVRIDEATERQALPRAAEALAGLHADGRSVAGGEECSKLNRYDGPYLERWERRWVKAMSQLADGRPWITLAARRVGEAMDALDGPDHTIVHGEAYVGNVLLRGGAALILDWESVGVGMGELDLAALLLRWPEEDARSAETAYARARWPRGHPVGFDRRLQAARLHTLGLLLHRRLAGRRDPGRLERVLRETEVTCERLGLLQ